MSLDIASLLILYLKEKEEQSPHSFTKYSAAFQNKSKEFLLLIIKLHKSHAMEINYNSFYQITMLMEKMEVLSPPNYRTFY